MKRFGNNPHVTRHMSVSRQLDMSDRYEDCHDWQRADRYPPMTCDCGKAAHFSPVGMYQCSCGKVYAGCKWI